MGCKNKIPKENPELNPGPNSVRKTQADLLVLSKNPFIFAARLEFRIYNLKFQSRGAVAQLVEQRTENPCVGGSIPPHTTKNLR